jgi:hypothetical protein
MKTKRRRKNRLLQNRSKAIKLLETMMIRLVPRRMTTKYLINTKRNLQVRKQKLRLNQSMINEQRSKLLSISFQVATVDAEITEETAIGEAVRTISEEMESSEGTTTTAEEETITTEEEEEAISRT